MLVAAVLIAALIGLAWALMNLGQRSEDMDFKDFQNYLYRKYIERGNKR